MSAGPRAGHLTQRRKGAEAALGPLPSEAANWRKDFSSALPDQNLIGLTQTPKRFLRRGLRARHMGFGITQGVFVPTLYCRYAANA